MKLAWYEVYNEHAQVVRGDRKLAVGVLVEAMSGKFVAIAIEAAAPANTAEAVFGDHAHELIGRYETAAAAKRAAEGYAAKWLRRRPAAPRCACPPIARASSTSKARR